MTGLTILALILAMVAPAVADDPGLNYKFNWSGGTNTYNPNTGWTYGFDNRDGSQNKYHSYDGSWSYGLGDGQREIMKYRTGGTATGIVGSQGYLTWLDVAFWINLVPGIYFNNISNLNS